MNYTAQIIIELIVNYVQEQIHSVVYLQSGWVICLNPDCEWKFDNTSVTNVNTDDGNSTSLIVGLAVGTLLLCATIASILCIIKIIKKKSRFEHLYLCKHLLANVNDFNLLQLVHAGGLVLVRSPFLIFQDKF